MSSVRRPRGKLFQIRKPAAPKLKSSHTQTVIILKQHRIFWAQIHKLPQFLEHMLRQNKKDIQPH